MNVIRVNGLVKRYRDVHALKGISLTVERGEVFALLGPNGSGKTTALEILMGLRSIDEGTVEYVDKGGEVSEMPRIGPVFQSQMYYDRLTVRELIKYYSNFYRSPSTAMPRYLEMMSLKDKLGSTFRHLSGGQKQQLAIVLALVNDPEILFFDEPTTALDPQVRLKIWELIRVLKKEGKTIIFTSHYIEEAEALADRVSILSKGELVVTDTPQNIIRRYNNRCNVELCFKGDVAIPAIEAYGFANVQLINGVCSFNVQAIDADVMRKLSDLCDLYPLSRIEIGKESLQSVFVKITEEAVS